MQTDWYIEKWVYGRELVRFRNDECPIEGCGEFHSPPRRTHVSMAAAAASAMFGTATTSMSVYASRPATQSPSVRICTGTPAWRYAMYNERSAEPNEPTPAYQMSELSLYRMATGAPLGCTIPSATMSSKLPRALRARRTVGYLVFIAGVCERLVSANQHHER
jgi:hypothetical protein